MNEPKKPPLFAVSNRHAVGEIPPPSIDGDEPKSYHSYFENFHGDQSLFVYRRDTEEARVYSGDAGWSSFPIVKGKVAGLHLSPDEELWLSACLKAIGMVTP